MTYRIVPCPKCNRLHGVVAVSRVRASRTRLDDSAASWGTARDRVESEASEPLSAVVTPVTAKPMPTSRRRRTPPLNGAGG